MFGEERKRERVYSVECRRREKRRERERERERVAVLPQRVRFGGESASISRRDQASPLHTTTTTILY